MFGICFRMLGNRADAEDVLQESFLSAFLKINQLKVDKNFGSWLRQIVIRKCIAFCKRKIPWVELSSESITSSEETDDTWIFEIKLENVLIEIESLPSGCRQVFVLYAMEQLTHKEIALLLGIAESTSKNQYKRAKNLLRIKLKKEI